ncbi:MAG TPA: polymer-forming cytoskeletal protein [Anaerolineales bacterium]|nr:polymer-forming cytoskeletal protein [Anaerolineales bacterium]
MRKYITAGWALLVLLFLSACGEQGSYTVTLLTYGDHALRPGEARIGDIYMFNGELTIPEGARLEGSLFILSGKAEIAGVVAGDISLVGGELALEPGAQVGGMLRLGEGEVQRAPGVQVGGGVQSGLGIEALAANAPAQAPGGFVSPLILQDLFVIAAAYLLARYWPAPLSRVADTLERYALAAGAMGLLYGFVGVVLLTLMAFTVILLPATFLGGLVLLLALTYGWVGFGGLLGRLLRRVTGWKLALPWEVAAGTVLFLVLYEISRNIPLLQDLVPLVTGLVGFGAVMLTRFGLRHFTPAIDRDTLEGFPAPGTEV